MKRNPLIELPIIIIASVCVFHFIIFPFLTTADTESNIFAVFIMLSWVIIVILYGITLFNDEQDKPEVKKSKRKQIKK